METLETGNSRTVMDALLRLKRFTGLIEEVIGRRSKKRLCAMIDRGMADNSQSWEFPTLVISGILREVKQSNYLTDKLIESGDREVAYNIICASLTHEREGKKSFWIFKKYLTFRDEEKERLITFVVSGESTAASFFYARWLLMFARGIPYSSQQLLTRTYFSLHAEFTGPDDFLEVYEGWDGLSPDLRENIRNIIKRALSMFRFRLFKKEKPGKIPVEDASGEGREPDPNCS